MRYHFGLESMAHAPIMLYNCLWISDQVVRPIISVSDHGTYSHLALQFLLGLRPGYEIRLLRLTLDATYSSRDHKRQEIDLPPRNLGHPESRCWDFFVESLARIPSVRPAFRQAKS